MQQKKILSIITYRPCLKEGDNMKNLTNKAKKLYKKLFAAKGKDKTPTKDNFNLFTIKLIISSTRRSPFLYHF